jgi:hypothetical protein
LKLEKEQDMKFRFLLTALIVFCLLNPANLKAQSTTVKSKFPDYPVQSASQYSSCQTKNGISLAIEPVQDADEQKKYFGTKFGGQGFLPVLVVLENASEDSSLLLQKGLITYRIEGKESKEVNGSVSVRSKSGEVVGLYGAIALSLPAMFVAAALLSSASKVQQNILVKELRSQTIAPGKAGNGFLYLPIGKPEKSNTEKRKLLLTIPISLDDKPEKVEFVFELEIPENGKK